MLKSIKVEERVHQELLEARNKAESMSDTVEKLIFVAKIVQRAFRAPPLEQMTLAEARATYERGKEKKLGGDSPPVPDLPVH